MTVLAIVLIVWFGLRGLRALGNIFYDELDWNQDIPGLNEMGTVVTSVVFIIAISLVML